MASRGRINPNAGMNANAGVMSVIALIGVAVALGMGAVGVAGFVLSLVYTGTCNGVPVCDRVRSLESTVGGAAAMNALSPINTAGAPFIVPNTTNPAEMYDLTSSSIEFNPMYASAVHITGNGYLLQSPDTSGQTGDAGQFNGGGLGNKIFVGLRQACGRPLTSFQGMEFYAFTRRGVASQINVNILIDVEGDGIFNDAGDDCIVVVDEDVDPRFTLPLSGAASAITLLPSDNLYRSVNAKCNLPTSAAGVTAPLTDILTSFPDAVLYCGEMTDNGYPVSTPMAAIQFIQGDTALLTFKETVMWGLSAFFA